jgi:glycosyltransferase involved in cell wall biosynthesis
MLPIALTSAPLSTLSYQAPSHERPVTGISNDMRQNNTAPELANDRNEDAADGDQPHNRRSTSAMIYVINCGGRTGPGGMPRMVDYYMTEWEAQDRWPKLILIDSTGPSYDWRRQPLFAIWRQPIYCIRALARVAVAGMLGRVAALHIHMADRGSVLRKALFVYLGMIIKRPVIIHMHAATFAEFYAGLTPAFQSCVKHVLRQADRFIVLGQAHRLYFTDTIKLDANRVVIAHNAVPAPSALSPPIPGQLCHLLFVGTLIERKGLKDLLQALAQPSVRALPWYLRIVGEGDQRRWVSLVEAHGLCGRVDFVGWVSSDGVHQLLEKSDVLVLPSLNEALPMIILEAMAHARPVIATPVGSVCDAVEDEVTGLLVPPSSPDALAQALKRIIVDHDLRLELGATARRVIDERFTISRLNSQLEELFGQVLGSCRKER